MRVRKLQYILRDNMTKQQVLHLMQLSFNAGQHSGSLNPYEASLQIVELEG